MDDKIKISIIIWAKSTNPVFFRDCLDTIAAQKYRDFEIVLLDDNHGNEAMRIAGEVFPHDGRLNYHRLKAHKGLSYALNVGLHNKNGNYVFFMGQHDRISDNALSLFVEEIKAHPGVDIIYSDRDELVGMHRMNPAFLPSFNVELLRHTNYIGENILVSVEALKKLGVLREDLESAAIYELLLRAVEKNMYVRHIPNLLYHTRVLGELMLSAQMKQIVEQVYREHMTVVSAHLHRCGVEGKVTADRSGEFWRIHYDGSDARSHRSDFIVVHEKGVTIRQKHFVERMYGILKQHDVGMVGVRFEKGGFLIDNCGYIIDNKGIAYPACHNQTALSKGYMNRAILPHDVVMVDPAFFMIDSKVLEKVGGFDRRLRGRALMLDLCMKIRSARRRIVFDPGVIARKPRGIQDESSENSNNLLQELWENELKNGDPYYNPNLPMGLQNYYLYT